MPASFLPTRTFQAYQIFAANTNVGKTILSTGLCRAAAHLGKETNKRVFYLKPVQTGYPADSDARHVKTYAPGVHTEMLYAYPDPVSPHMATDKPPKDSQVMDDTIAQLREYVRQGQKANGAYAFVETAGGIHSPVMSGTPQVDFYRPLRLPSILVGDGNLGGISTTMASYESLSIRGYDIPSILLFNNDRYRNHQVLADQLVGKTWVATAPAPPAPLEDPVKEAESMQKYYAQLDEHLVPVVKKLNEIHEQRFDRLEQMAQKSRDVFWWPFTQHQTVKQTTVIDSAYNDLFTTYNTTSSGDMEPREMFDSCASWWTQGLGHANPQLTLAAARAAGRYGHVMFPESTNEPALSLAEKVLEKDTWASRVFFSDNGSTALEVALKMALRSAAVRYGWSNDVPVDVLGIEGGYHGDTIGTMDACPPGIYNEQVQWYQPRGHWLKPPSVHVSKGETYIRLPAELGSDKQQVPYASLSHVYSVDQQGTKRDPALAKVYQEYIRAELQGIRSQKRHLGALLMEPVLMGAGGMIFVDPLFQRVLVDTVRQEGANLLGYQAQGNTNGWQGLPVIFDEVFAGWYRLGRRSASEFLGVTPDIVGYAKTLTGGLVPLALTVTKEEIFNIFLSNNKPDCLLHGHSYTAHPIGCSVAKESIEILDRLAGTTHKQNWTPFRQGWKDSSIWSMWSRDVVDQVSHLPQVQSVMTMGSVLAVELKDDQSQGYASFITQSIIQKMRNDTFKDADINLFARSLGNVLYLMTSQVSTPHGVRQCERILLDCLA